MENIEVIITIVSSIISLFFIIKNEINKYQHQIIDSKKLAKDELLRRHATKKKDIIKAMSEDELKQLLNGDTKAFNSLDNLEPELDSFKISSIFIDNLLLTTRFRFSHFLIKNVTGKSSMSKTLRLFLALIANYVYYIAYIIWLLFVFFMLTFIIAYPLILILMFFSHIYLNLHTSSAKIYFFMVIFIVSLPLIIFGSKKN